MSFKFISLFLVIILECASCQKCFLRFGSNRPTILRNIGQKTFIDNGNKIQNNTLILSEKETVELFCENGFELHQSAYPAPDDKIVPHEIKSLGFECTGSDYHYKRLTIQNLEYYHWFNVDRNFQCATNSPQIFVSNTTLENCENYVSYGLKTDLNATVGICFDLETFHIKYAKYIANQPAHDFLNKKTIAVPTIVDLDVELNNFPYLLDNYFISEETFNTLFAAKQSEHLLLKPFLLEYESLVQEYGKFEPLFKVIWWRVLRLGNWFEFNSALNKRTEHFSYLIYTGVSGSMVMPTVKVAEVFEVSEGDKSVKAPAYIWSYLKSIDGNSTEEFVVVGHNTPYYETFPKSEEICEDICNEIDWLKTVFFTNCILCPFFALLIAVVQTKLPVNLKIFQ